MAEADVIRTTHTGSLPPALPGQARLQELLAARVRGEPGHELPAGVTLAASVIDSCSTSVEHEETVAADLVEIAGIVGRGCLMAATDCGFRTMIGLGQYRYVTEQKLRALVAGTCLANERLAGSGTSSSASGSA